MEIFGFEWTWHGGLAGGAIFVVLVFIYRNIRRILYLVEFLCHFVFSAANIEKSHAYNKKRSVDAKNDEIKIIDVISKMREEFIQKTQDIKTQIYNGWEEIKTAKKIAWNDLENKKKEFSHWVDLEKKIIFNERDLLKKEKIKTEAEILNLKMDAQLQISNDRQKFQLEMDALLLRKKTLRTEITDLLENLEGTLKNGDSVPDKNIIIKFFAEEKAAIIIEKKIIETEKAKLNQEKKASHDEINFLVRETRIKIQKETRYELDNLEKEKSRIELEIAKDKEELNCEIESVRSQLNFEKISLGKEKENFNAQVRAKETEIEKQDQKQYEQLQREQKNLEIKQQEYLKLKHQYDELTAQLSTKPSEDRIMIFLKKEKELLYKEQGIFEKDKKEFYESQKNTRTQIINLSVNEQRLKEYIKSNLEELETEFRKIPPAFSIMFEHSHCLKRISRVLINLRELNPSQKIRSSLVFIDGNGDPYGGLSSQWRD